MKKVFLLVGLLLTVSCQMEVSKKQASSDEVQKRQTEKMLVEANKQVGMPTIINFTEKKQAKRILELRDKENLIMHAYLFSEMTGKLIYLGKCIGYGLPYSTQFSNPNKLGTVDGGEMGARNPYLLPQAEPNGLFTPTGLSATWLELIDPVTKKGRIVYVEPGIIVSPFKLQ